MKYFHKIVLASALLMKYLEDQPQDNSPSSFQRQEASCGCQEGLYIFPYFKRKIDYIVMT